MGTLKFPLGLWGAIGPAGTNGWSPLMRGAVSGDIVALEIYDWSGGAGDKPATGYLGDGAIVAAIGDALNLTTLVGIAGESTAEEVIAGLATGKYVSPSGNRAGLDARVGLDAAVARAAGLVDPDFAEVAVDPAGRVIWAETHDGQRIAAGALAAHRLGVTQDEDSNVWLVRAGNVTPGAGEAPAKLQVTRDGDGASVLYLDARIKGATLHLLREESGAVTHIEHDLSCPLPDLAATVTKLVAFPIDGQSLVPEHLSAPALLTDPVRPGRAQMFDAGLRVLANGHHGTYVSRAVLQRHLRGLKDLRGENYLLSGGSLWPAFARDITDTTKTGAHPATEAVVPFVVGISAASYAQLASGTVPFANLETALKRLRLIAFVRGYEFEVGAVLWLHGGANVADSEATYAGHITEFQDDLTAFCDTWGIGYGAAGKVKLLLDQDCSWTVTAHGLTSDMPLGHLKAALDRPTTIFLAGPRYPRSYTDGTHFDNIGGRDYGSVLGQAWRSVRATDAWLPLHILDAVRTSQRIILQHHNPSGTNLSLSEALVDTPNGDAMGFEWVDGGAAAIGSVDVDGVETTMITADAPMSGTGPVSVAYTAPGSPVDAGPTTGVRTPLHDTSAEETPESVALHNYHVAQRKTVAVMRAETDAIVEAQVALGLVPPLVAVRAYDTLFAALDAEFEAGQGALLAKLNRLYLGTAPTEAAALINLLNPGTGDLVLNTGAATFTAWDRIAGSGANRFKTGFTPANLNTGAYSVWCPANADANAMLGVDGGTSYVFIQPKFAGDLFRGRVHHNFTGNTVAEATGIGMFTVLRRDGSNRAFYKNGTEVLNEADAANGLPSTEMCIGGTGAGAGEMSASPWRACWMSDQAVYASEVAGIYAALNACITSLLTLG